MLIAACCDRFGGASGNAAGAKYGTGYCDAQCPQDIKFIDGVANDMSWNACVHHAAMFWPDAPVTATTTTTITTTTI